MNDQLRRMALDHIATHGHSVIGVDDKPSFAYTIGLSARFGYELIAVGLPQHFACAIFNDIATCLAAGEAIEMGVPDDRWANLPVRFRECTEKARDYVCQADAFYGRPVRAVQMVLSDKNGLFPEDPGYDSEYMDPRTRVI